MSMICGNATLPAETKIGILMILLSQIVSENIKSDLVQIVDWPLQCTQGYVHTVVYKRIYNEVGLTN